MSGSPTPHDATPAPRANAFGTPALNGAAQQAHEFSYPYAQHATAPAPAPTPAAAPAPADVPVVQPHELAPVDVPLPPGEQRYYAPVPPARDPRRTALASVITFACVVIALWGLLGFMGEMSRTLASVKSGTEQIKTQLTTANEGLGQLDAKTSHLETLANDSVTLKQQLGGIDTGMGAMLTGVDKIATSMQNMNGSLTVLGSELDKFNTTDRAISAQLGGINTGLAGQRTSIDGMAKDVKGTGATLGGLPPRLNATNARLRHVNGVVNFMGCRGILQKLKVNVFLGPIRNGSAQIDATVVPPGAWGTNMDGSPCR